MCSAEMGVDLARKGEQGGVSAKMVGGKGGMEDLREGGMAEADKRAELEDRVRREGLEEM